MASRSEKLTFRVYPEMKVALEKAARIEDRTIAYKANAIVTQWLIDNGFLKSSDESG